MTRHLTTLLLGLAATTADAAIVDSIHQLRQSGCGARRPPPALHADRTLLRAAELWSQGRTLDQALRDAGYRADSIHALRIEGSDRQVLAQLRAQACPQLRDASLRDLAVFEKGQRHWILLARPYQSPPVADRAAIALQVLEIVNKERSHGRRCGNQTMPVVAPLRLSEVLAGAAGSHAREMARLNRLDHRGIAGSSAADRARRGGYRPRLIGENIAVGAETAAEVMQGWLASPGHCENLMDARFTEMGLAFADGGPGSGGVYWAQLFGAPLLR